MRFHYSSIHLHEPIDSLEKLAKKIDIKYIELYPDTNICIFLRDFYKEPSSIVKRDKLWHELKGLLRSIEAYDLIVDFSLGIEEACRNKNNFELSEEKFIDMNQSIKALFEMNYIEMLEHSKLIKFKSEIKDTTQKLPTKMNSLESINIFQNSLYLNYACLLKMFLLDINKEDKSNLQLMIEFLDFVEKEVDLFSTSIMIFSYYFFSGNSSIKRLIHKSKNILEDKVHSIWNASIDLTFPGIINQQFLESKKIPVFVTGDEKLHLILNSIKARIMVTAGDSFVLPTLTELDLSNTGWGIEDLEIIQEHYYEIMIRRKYKFIFERFKQDAALHNLRNLCYKLENELKSIF